MTTGEQKMLVRGVAGGLIMGMAIGLMLALLIAVRPQLFAGLLH
jgi:tetrahydromethanopterin S-methyltransferase subunit F